MSTPNSVVKLASLFADLQRLEGELTVKRDEIETQVKVAHVDDGVDMETIATECDRSILMLRWYLVRSDPPPPRSARSDAEDGFEAPFEGIGATEAARTVGVSRTRLFRMIGGRKEGVVSGIRFAGVDGRLCFYLADETS